MKPDIPLVLDKIDYFNALCFGGELPPIPVRLSCARTFLGKITYKYRRNFFGKIVGCTDYMLSVSKSFNYTERELEDVILHELIHYYISYKCIKDTSAHGKVFRKMMADINSEYGRNIRISYKLKPEDRT